MRVRTSCALALPLALALASCGDDAAPEEQAPAQQGGEVAGDVLGGTISDDMLPLDALTSQSPPAERADADNGANEEGAAPS